MTNVHILANKHHHPSVSRTPSFAKPDTNSQPNAVKVHPGQIYSGSAVGTAKYFWAMTGRSVKCLLIN